MPSEDSWQFARMFITQTAYDLVDLSERPVLQLEVAPGLALKMGNKLCTAVFTLVLQFKDDEKSEVLNSASVRVDGKYVTNFDKDDQNVENYAKEIALHAIERLPAYALADIQRAMLAAGVDSPLPYGYNDIREKFDIKRMDNRNRQE